MGHGQVGGNVREQGKDSGVRRRSAEVPGGPSTSMRTRREDIVYASGGEKPSFATIMGDFEDLFGGEGGRGSSCVAPWTARPNY